MLDENSVNAEVKEDVVDLQEAETESEQSEVASDTVEEVTQEQSQEENHKFKEFRLKAEREKSEAVQKAKDELIAEQYGKSHGIYTESDFKKALAEEKERELLEQMKSDEVDPKEIYKSLKMNDPEFKELQQFKTDNAINRELTELNKDLAEMELDIKIGSIDELDKLPNTQAIVDHINKGKTLAEAYFLANRKEIIKKQAEKVQLETLRKKESLIGSSPGALDQSAGTEHKDSYSSMSKEDFEKLKDDVLMRRR